MTTHPQPSLAGSLSSMSEIQQPPPGAWRLRDVAAHLEIKPDTVRAYNTRGQMPPPDGRDDYGRPWWHPSTIEGWQRPGRGNRSDRRGHPKPKAAPERG